MNILEQTYQLGGAEYRAVMDFNGGYSIFRDGVFAGEVTPCRTCREEMRYEVSLPSGEVVGSFYCDDCEGTVMIARAFIRMTLVAKYYTNMP
jgi:hypothetical protein